MRKLKLLKHQIEERINAHKVRIEEINQDFEREEKEGGYIFEEGTAHEMELERDMCEAELKWLKNISKNFFKYDDTKVTYWYKARK